MTAAVLRRVPIILLAVVLAGPAESQSKLPGWDNAAELCAINPMACGTGPDLRAPKGDPPLAWAGEPPLGAAPEVALQDICTLCRCCLDGGSAGERAVIVPPDAAAPLPAVPDLSAPLKGF